LVWICLGQEWLGEKCMDNVVDGVGPGGSPKESWSETVEKDCQA